MVGQGEQPIKKTVEEISMKTEEALARTDRLEVAVVGKRHSEWKDDLGSSEDDVGEDARSLRHHPKYNR
jgi:hypothetical protein